MNVSKTEAKVSKMASFRNSSVPEWAANENNGYFQSRTSGGARNQPRRDGGQGRQSNVTEIPMPKHEACLPKDPVKASKTVKGCRIRMAVRDAYVWQMVLFVILFLVFPLDLENPAFEHQKQLGYIQRTVQTCYAAMFCTPGLFFIFTLYLTMNMFGILMTNSDKYGPTIHHQIKRCISFGFLMKPILLISFIMADYNYFLEMFDVKYRNVLRSKLSSTNCTFRGEERCFFIEENLVIRIAVCIATLNFFVHSYKNGKFTLKFTSVPVTRYMFGLFDFSEMVKSARSSIILASGTGFACLLVGPVFYCSILYPFGIKMWETRFLERIFLFLNISFLIRLFLYSFLARTLLPMLLKLINYRLTQPVNFHVQETTGHRQCLILNEAMSGERGYFKLLAFYEYSFKTDVGNSDLSVYFKTTHPGNRPETWNNLYNASVRAMGFMNDCAISFLKSVKMPANFLQSGLGPYILHQLRERETTNQQSNAPVNSAELPRAGGMRDLTSSNRPNFPNQIPTITEAIRQNLELLWNDVKGFVVGLFSMQTLNNTVFGGKLDTIIPENVISNILSDHLITYWAMMGTVKLMCASVVVDTRGIVNPSIKSFLVKILETYDTVTALEMYTIKAIDDQVAVNKKLSNKNKEIASKMSNACTFALSKLDQTFSTCYPILNIDAELQNRIADIISNRERP